MTERLDKYLVSCGLAKSRERAKTLISEGKVFVNGTAADKPSVVIGPDDTVTADDDLGYVGRGALKLIKALDVFEIDLNGCICADLGASTGGFTQVMLERGAAKVYAVDVGHGQLDSSLSNDERVIDLEGINVRELTDELIPEKLSFISADLSFISLKNVISEIEHFLEENGRAVVLIKPQFEAGRSALNKNGIVKDTKDHIRVLDDLCSAFQSNGLFVSRITFSPIKGGSGNIEYLALLERTAPRIVPDTRSTVKEAFDVLRK